MIQETKDSIANLTTVAGTGSAILGLNEILTILLIVTGIVLNIARLMEIRKRNQD